MNLISNIKTCFFSVCLLLSFFANNDNTKYKDSIDLCNSNVKSKSLLDSFLVGSITYDGVTLAVNSAKISDFGSNNFSDNHYEYYLTLSDGVYNGGNEYIGGTYSITIELLSLGSSFNYGDFPSCFFCDNTTTFSYVGHLFLIEDTNDDDQLDFNSDSFSNGSTGVVKINQNNNITNLKIDFIMADGKELKGSYSGVFPINPILR